MGSDLTRSDLDTLISMEMKLRLLDLENITIPEAPPPVPKEPSSYNFTYNYSWDVCVRACLQCMHVFVKDEYAQFFDEFSEYVEKADFFFFLNISEPWRLLLVCDAG